MQTQKRIDLSRLRILVAATPAWDLRQITSMLRAFGAQDIFSCRDGGEATDAIENNYPDLAIICEALSGTPASEVIARTRRHKSRSVNHLPIVYIANVLRRADIEHIARLGVHEIVCRPFSTKTLIDRVYWTCIAPRPFIRTETYFGPEPRTRLWQSIIGIAPPAETLDEIHEPAVPQPGVIEL